MKDLLAKCTAEDFEFISEVLDSYFAFTDDQKRKLLLKGVQEGEVDRQELIYLLDKQIRYYGSSDVAYLKRLIFSDDPGVSAEEVVDDVVKNLKVNTKAGASIEAKLEQVVKQKVEATLAKKTPEELAETFRKMKLDSVKVEDLTIYLKGRGKVLTLPILMQFLGPVVVQKVLLEVVLGFIAQIIGKQAFNQVARLIAQRFGAAPLGPIVWGVSGLWLASDLQGPAMRKTVPICLYLGVVALRDGEEDSELDDAV
ncbi:hypothetical protein [Ferrimonas balearica]|uniref:hypothetical protein n=1 Tax=Ferrimonas balearica TaxID=44012 RepID=UPI001C98F48D|nr:hypothetical protein [Ferrimonas balearica]MBY5920943.1 hypothetical protein [Ferrimonas balearica]MBY5996372.1 hypothetical protein [Ferrimonas balearica]